MLPKSDQPTPHDPKEAAASQPCDIAQKPTPNGTARRPGPPKPVTFKDFASI